jgi:hypothetical protein
MVLGRATCADGSGQGVALERTRRARPLDESVRAPRNEARKNLLKYILRMFLHTISYAVAYE